MGPRGVLDDIRAWVAEAARVAPDTIDPSTTLRTLGLDSLGTVELAHRLERELGARLPAHVVMANPSLRELADAVVASRDGAGPEPLTRAQERPLSAAEQELWAFGQTIEDGVDPFTTLLRAQLPEGVDADALERALNGLLERHDALRTVYRSREDTPYATVDETARLRLRRVPAGDVQTLMDEELVRPFDLEHGPLIRATLVERASVLILAMPHIAIDLWSASIVLRDLALLYGEPATVPPPAEHRYEAFVQRQSSLVAGDEGERQWRYWQTQLDGELPISALATDRPRPARQSLRSGGFSTTLSAAIGDQVRAFAREHQTTPFTVLLTAFQTVLHRWSGQSDVLVATPTHGRNRAADRDVVGLFVNTVAIRSRLEPQTRLVDLLEATERRVRAAQAHSDLPYGTVVSRLSLPRDPGRAPLCQTMFALEAAPATAPDTTLRFSGAGATAGELTLDAFGIRQSVRQFDLVLMAAEHAGGYALQLDFASDLFDAATIERLATAFRTVLEHLLAQEETPVASAPLYGREERASLLAGMRGPTVELGGPRTLPAALAATTARTPDAIALLRSDGFAMRYAELSDAAGRLARALHHAGVRRGSRVGLCVPRSCEAIVAICGVLEAGALYVPLDPAYAPARLRFMVADAACDIVLVTERTAGIGGWDVPELRVDGELPDTPDVALEAVQPQDGAYVMYTSGSTGEPKGVLVEHGAVVNHNAAFTRLVDLSAADRVLQFGSLSFDPSVQEIFPTLRAGATVVIPASIEPMAPFELEQLIAGAAVTAMYLPAAYWHQWVDSMHPDLPARCPSLRYVQAGGEAPSTAKLLRWRERGGSRWSNGYGPTEATVIACANEPGDAGHGSVPIGRPLANMAAYLLDAHLEPVPDGVVGELYLSGAGLAREYLNNPELTAQRFVPDPFGAGRLYRTGDRARRTAAGDIEFLGRRDRQVKLRGFRVEPGEVEATVARCDGVTEAAVVIREDRPGEHRMVAYVAGDVGAERVREQLAEWLPPYLLPNHIVVLDRLPVTPGGKVDRAALPAPVPQVALPTAPLTPVELELAAAWTEVLGVAAPGVHDNFFEQGGDSIQAIRLVGRCAARNVALTVREVLEHQTIAELAGVARLGGTRAARPAPTGETPLLPMQQWFFDQRPHDPGHCVQSVLLDTPAPLDLDAVGTAVDALVAQHDALRLAFTAGEDGVWRQAYRPAVPTVDVVAVDLRAVEPAQRTAAIEAQASALHAAHELAHPPLLRAAAFVSDRGQLLLSVHHLVVDGVSWRILLEDFELAYGQAVRGEAVRLPERTSSIRDWADALPRVTEPPARSGAALPRDLDAPLDLEADARERTFGLDARETEALLRQPGITEVLLAALAAGLHPWVDGDAIAVDVEGHGRAARSEDLDLTRTVGWFTAMSPITLPLGADPAALAPVIGEALRAVPHGGAAYGLLADGAEISFNYLGQITEAVTTQVGTVRSPRNRRPHTLEIIAAVVDGALRLTIAYGAKRHLAATVDGLGERIVAALRAVASRQVVLPLTPLQRGLLFESLASRDPDAYVCRLRCRFRQLDPAALQQAVSAVVARHAALRTSFRWEGVPQPVQVIAAAGEPAWQPEADGPLDLSTPPVRWTLIELPDGATELVWTTHHLLIDGWSLGLIVHDLCEAYAAVVAGGQPDRTPSPALRAFTDWVDGQDRARASAYWREALAGITAPTAIADGGERSAGSATWSRALPAALTDRMRTFAREQRVTPGLLCQAAWALVLGRESECDDVLFGVVRSGRSAPVPDIDRMVGLLSNTVPARITLPRAASVSAWLRELQAQEVVRGEFECTPLADIARAGDIPPGTALFESLLVIENYPIAEAVASAAAIGLEDVRFAQRSEQPLTVVVIPGDPWRLELAHQLDRFSERQVEALGEAMIERLRTIVDAPHTTLEQLLPGVRAPAASRPLSLPRSTEPVAASGARELALADTWASILGGAPPGVHDDFFAHGGDSIQAIQLCEAVRQRFGTGVPVRDFLQEPTIAGLARSLRGASERERHLITLRAGDGPLALFLVHPVSGQASVFSALAGALDCAVYAFQSGGAPTSLSEMAAAYADELLETADGRRIALLGYSMGGLIAVEIAQRLADAGEPLERLILLDPAPEWGVALAPVHARELVPVPELEAIVERHGELLRRHHVQPYDGPAELILTADHPYRAGGVTRLLASPDVQRHPVGGEHLTVVDQPHVTELAAIVERLLAPAWVA